MNRRHCLSVAVALVVTLSAAGQPKLTKKFKLGPVTTALGYADGGAAATIKGEYIDTIGEIRHGFARGYGLNIDGIANSSKKQPDNLSLGGSIGFVDTTTAYPRSAIFLQLQGKTGQYKDETANALRRANQLVVGITAEFVPKRFTDWVLNKVKAEDGGFTIDPCHTDPVAMKTDECKAILEKEQKEAAPLELPPRFVIGLYRPLTTSGDQIKLPDGLESDKLTAEFIADNRIGVKFFGRPVRITASLAATYPITGDEKKLKGKVDLGVGLDVSKKFTPVVKYISGNKDGFTYSNSVLVGILWDFAKPLVPSLR